MASMCSMELAVCSGGGRVKLSAGGPMGVGALLAGGLAQLWQTALAWLRLRYEFSPRTRSPTHPTTHCVLLTSPGNDQRLRAWSHACMHALCDSRAAAQLAGFGCMPCVPTGPARMQFAVHPSYLSNIGPGCS